MRDHAAFRAKRIAAGIMGLMVLVCMLFSALYIVAEADHDCTGEDCAVCAFIQVLRDDLRGASDVLRLMQGIPFPAVLAVLCAAFSAASLRRDTPVLRKVRLNY